MLTVALAPGVGPRAVLDLAARGPLGAVAAAPREHDDLLKPPAARDLASGTARRRAEAEIAQAASAGVALVCWDDPRYPVLLRRLYDPPPVLYVRGTLPPPEAIAVAIVGARACTPGGQALARAMARDLARWGTVVVSGLARGIDTAAHEGALAGGGPTVAVLGCGVDRVYPPENARLAARIAGEGAVVSEFPFGAVPRAEHFPRRNRIIAGWSAGVVVVEARERSGALNTARTAADEGREVMAVPGHPSSPTAAGTNRLIREGAALVRGARDVAEELAIEALEAVAPRDGDAVLAALVDGTPCTLDEIGARSGLGTSALLARLTELEMRDEVRRLPGPLFVRHH